MSKNQLETNDNFKEEATCKICYEILIEPIKLLCGHELCIICATSLIENKLYSCPICRKKIPKVLWDHLPVLLNEERWKEIKKKLPNEVIQRLPDLIQFHKRETKRVRILK